MARKQRERSPAGVATVAAMSDYRTVNRANWDERAPVHAASKWYGFERFANDPTCTSVMWCVSTCLASATWTGLRAVCTCRSPRRHRTAGLAGATGARVTGLDSLRRGGETGPRAGPPWLQASSSSTSSSPPMVYDAVSVLGEGQFDLVFDRNRRPMQAAVDHPLGAGGVHPAPTGWSSGSSGEGQSDPVGRSDDTRKMACWCWTSRTSRKRRRVVWDEQQQHLCGPRRLVHPHRYPQLEPPDRRSGDRADGGRTRPDHVLVEHDTVPWEALPGRMTQVELNEWRLHRPPEPAAVDLHPAGPQALIARDQADWRRTSSGSKMTDVTRWPSRPPARARPSTARAAMSSSG